MPNIVNSKGFYKSKELQSKDHTFYENFVENIQNMEHGELWKTKSPVKFGVFYRQNGDDTYFLFATNMKRNYDNLNAEFTPYRHDEEKINTVSTHGYGGIALPLKIGGHMHIYFSNTDEFSIKNSDYEELSMDIDGFMQIARSNDNTKELPTPNYSKKIPNHSQMICFMENIWGKELLHHFQEQNYKTFYVFYNSNLGNTSAELTIPNYLKQEIDESFQNQFIELLEKKYVEFVSSYVPSSFNILPQAFYSELPENTAISIRGKGYLTEVESLEFMRPIDKHSNTLYWRHNETFGKVEFENNSSTIKTSTKVEFDAVQFKPDFVIHTGILPDNIQLYSDSFSLANKKGFTLEIEAKGVFAEGVFVDVGEIPLTCMPIAHYVDDSSHLSGNRKRRTFVSIYPETFVEWKESIYPSEMKEDATFTQGSILLKAIEFIIKRYDAARPAKKLKKSFIEVLDMEKIIKSKTKEAVQKGNEFEVITITTWLNSIPDVTLLHGDLNIKKKFKLKGQGIDHVLKFNGTNTTILIQDKFQDRTAKEKIQSYVDSVEEYRNKFSTEKVYSLFINGKESVVKTHYSLMNNMICNNCILKQETETDEQFKQRLITLIQKINMLFL